MLIRSINVQGEGIYKPSLILKILMWRQVKTALFCVITQQVLLIPYDVSGQRIGFIFYGPFKMEPLSYPEKSVYNYH